MSFSSFRHLPDGKVDVLSGGGSNGGTHEVYLAFGVGDGTFTGAVSFGGAYFPQPINVQLVDINNDGKLDIFSGGGDNSIATYRPIKVALGNGDGTFGAMLSRDSAPQSDARILDLNGDGLLDLVAANSGVIRTHLGNGDGTFSTGASYNAPSIAVMRAGDWNGDVEPGPCGGERFSQIPIREEESGGISYAGFSTGVSFID